MFDKSLPMTGFEPQISGVGGNRSTNWAKTTAWIVVVLWVKKEQTGELWPYLERIQQHEDDVIGFDNYQQFYAQQNTNRTLGQT